MQSWLPFLPEAASTLARRVDALYLYMVAITAFFTVLIVGVLIYFVLKYRRRVAYEIPQPIAGSVKLETMWTVVPFIIAMSMFVWGASVYFAQYRPPANAMEIYVVGKQWMWKFQHQTGQREINELHVPVGRKVKLTMTTEDVIHSFFVPAFRLKADVIPGRYTYYWFEATQPGRYHLFCAEYCGTNHSGMGGWIVVMDPTDYDNWLSGNANQESPVAAGQKIFQTLGCASCHGQNGEGGRGPTFTGLLNSKTQLEGGQTVEADEAYIRNSILNPSEQIVAGYQNIMPTFKGQVTEEQMLLLISYIKSLSPSQTSGISTTAPARSNNQSTGGAATPATQSSSSGNPDEQRSNPIGSTPPRGNQSSPSSNQNSPR